MLKITNGRNEFYQWDIGQSLTLSLPEGESVSEVHIGNDRCEHFYVVEPIDNMVAVYDELLQSGKRVIAYEYVKSEKDGHTIRKYAFNVARRPKADQYEYTPTQSYSWEWWCERAKQYAETAQSEVASIPSKMAEWWTIHKPEIVEEIKTAIPPYDDTEIRGEIASLQQAISEKMEFYLVEGRGGYNAVEFWHDGTRLYYNDLVEKYNDPQYWVYAEFEGLTFIPSLPPLETDPILEFICTWIYGGRPHVARLVINSDNEGKYDGLDVAMYTEITDVKESLNEKAEKSELDGKVGFTDFASGSKGGVVRIERSFGTNSDSRGFFYGQAFTMEQYPSLNDVGFISKKTLENVLAERLKEPQFELIEEITLTEDVARIDRSAEPNGTPYNFKKLIIDIEAITSGTTIHTIVNGNSKTQSYMACSSNVVQFNCTRYDIDCGVCLTRYHESSTSNRGQAGRLMERNYEPIMIDKITTLQINSTTFKSGTKIKIYGVRA